MAKFFDIPSKYAFQRELTGGLLCKTALFQDNDTHKFLCCKKYMKSSFGAQDKVDKFIEKVEKIKNVKSPFIVPFFKVIEQEDCIYLLRDFIDTDPLSESLGQLAALDQVSVYIMWNMVVQSFQVLHKNGISPNFIRPNNMFIINNSIIRITDIVAPPIDIENVVHSPNVFELSFLAPEFFNNQKLNEKSDYWSLGILLYFLLTCRLPWNAKNIFTLMQQINTGKIVFTDEVIPEAKNAIDYLNKLDPEQRTIPANLSKVNRANSLASPRGGEISPLPKCPMSPTQRVTSGRLSHVGFMVLKTSNQNSAKSMMTINPSQAKLQMKPFKMRTREAPAMKGAPGNPNAPKSMANIAPQRLEDTLNEVNGEPKATAPQGKFMGPRNMSMF